MFQRREHSHGNYRNVRNSVGWDIVSRQYGYSSRHAHKVVTVGYQLMTQMNATFKAIPDSSARTEKEIKDMLKQAILTRNNWLEAFENCKQFQDRHGMMEAARNAKALEGVVKTLRWTLGEKGINNPLS